MRRAIFPGSFDPFTIGHRDVVERGLGMFDEIIIGVGINHAKQGMYSHEERVRMIKEAFEGEPRVRVMSYDGLTVDFAKEVGAEFILRGVRTVMDFEYERQIADANKHLSGIETVLLFADAKYSFISSSMVRDLHSHGKDIEPYTKKGKL